MALALGACSGRDKAAISTDAAEDGPAVAQVNDRAISAQQVSTLVQVEPRFQAQFGDAASERALDELVEQELAAQAALKAGLDKDPRVGQAMALARRQVLARAYREQLAGKALLPDTASVDRYYGEHPERFALMPRAQARHQIEAEMSAQRRQAAVEEGMASLRRNARIQRKPVQEPEAAASGS